MSSKNQRTGPKLGEGVQQAPDRQRRNANKGNDKHVRFGRPDGEASGSNPLAEPVYHSTAALGHQLKTFQGLEFDAEGTVLRALEGSEMARINFAEKVSEAVNISKKETKYTGLISLNVPVQATVAQEVEDRMSRLRTSDKPVWQKPSKASDVPPPDIMHAFTPDLIMEKPITDVPVSTPRELRPEPCSLESAFDLYRHMQCWDS